LARDVAVNTAFFSKLLGSRARERRARLTLAR